MVFSHLNKLVTKVGDFFSATKLADRINQSITGQTTNNSVMTDEERSYKDMNQEVYKPVAKRSEALHNFKLDKSVSDDEYSAYVNTDKKQVRHIYRGTANMGDVWEWKDILTGSDHHTTKMKRHREHMSKTRQKYSDHDHSLIRLNTNSVSAGE